MVSAAPGTEPAHRCEAGRGVHGGARRGTPSMVRQTPPYCAAAYSVSPESGQQPAHVSRR